MDHQTFSMGFRSGLSAGPPPSDAIFQKVALDIFACMLQVVILKKSVAIWIFLLYEKHKRS